MVGFTYFFVQQLPGTQPEETTTTLSTESTTTTENGDGETTTTDGSAIPAEVQAYDKMTGSKAELAGIEADLLDVNTQQDAVPREISYEDAWPDSRTSENPILGVRRRGRDRRATRRTTL